MRVVNIFASFSAVFSPAWYAKRSISGCPDAAAGVLCPFLAFVLGQRLGLPPRKITRRDAESLEQYDWPGNIRELQNVIERALIRARGDPLQFEFGEAGRTQDRELPRHAASEAPVGILTATAMRALERQNIERACRLRGSHLRFEWCGLAVGTETVHALVADALAVDYEAKITGSTDLANR